MKAVVQNAQGEPADVLEMVEVDHDRPGAGEVLIDVSLAPVHHGDLHLIRSQSRVGDGHLRRGSECLGIVREIGPGVRDRLAFEIGDRVIGFPAQGAWAESVVIQADAAIAVPPETGDEVAAQLLINFISAGMILRGLRASASHQALHDGMVLVTGASTVVSRILLSLLEDEGIATIGLTRSAASAHRVAAELEGVRLVATEDADWQSRIASLTLDREIVGVLDCVSGSLVEEFAPLLTDDAAVVTYGGLDGNKLAISALDLVDRQLLFRGVTFGRWFSEVSRVDQLADVRSAFEFAARKPWLFKTGGIFGLADFQEAISAVEAPNRDGFVFIRP